MSAFVYSVTGVIVKRGPNGEMPPSARLWSERAEYNLLSFFLTKVLMRLLSWVACNCWRSVSKRTTPKETSYVMCYSISVRKEQSIKGLSLSSYYFSVTQLWTQESLRSFRACCFPLFLWLYKKLRNKCSWQVKKKLDEKLDIYFKRFALTLVHEFESVKSFCVYLLSKDLHWDKNSPSKGPKWFLHHRSWWTRWSRTVHSVLWHEWQNGSWRDSRRSRQREQNTCQWIRFTRKLCTKCALPSGWPCWYSTTGWPSWCIYSLRAVYQVQVLSFSPLQRQYIWLVGGTWRIQNAVLGWSKTNWLPEVRVRSNHSKFMCRFAARMQLRQKWWFLAWGQRSAHWKVSPSRDAAEVWGYRKWRASLPYPGKTQVLWISHIGRDLPHEGLSKRVCLMGSLIYNWVLSNELKKVE